MNRNLIIITALLLGFTSCIKDRLAPAPVVNANPNLELIHYWNFNDSTSLLAATKTIGGGGITVGGTYDAVENGSLLNARNGDDTGSALRVRNPSTTMTWALPTTSHKTPVVSFALMRTSSGALQNLISYTTDGVNYTDTAIALTTINAAESWTLFTIDFSGIAASADNPAFAVKITYAGGNTATSGNDRYDNLACEAEAIPVPPPPASDSLIHYWNFNRNTSDMAAFLQPDNSIGGASLSYSAASDTAQSGTTVNAYHGDGGGNALRLKNPSGNFTLALPTTGFKNIILKYATARNSAGPQSQAIAYSLDGSTFTSVGLTPYTNAAGTDYAQVAYDFSAISGAANNPNFKIRMSFSVGNGNPAGYTLLDNIAVEGDQQ